MSSEVHKHIEKPSVKNESLFNAEVINFPKDKKVNNLIESKKIDENFWKINDKSNVDQLKAVVGICFMFGTLFFLGLYSNLM